jgi:hypothetical protein
MRGEIRGKAIKGKRNRSEKRDSKGRKKIQGRQEERKGNKRREGMKSVTKE